MLDAQCDFAAVTYGPVDDPDRLLGEFAEDLRGRGFRPVGLLQRGRRCEPDAALGAVMLPRAQVVHLPHAAAHGGQRCTIDSAALAELAATIASAVDQGADLVILNRFGKLEAQGRGLIALVKQAADADIAVLIAVPEHRFAAWIAYAGGMSVRLPCRRPALDHWWQTVAGRASPRRDAGTFCDLAK